MAEGGLAKMVKALEEATYAPAEYEKTARSVAHPLQKAIDGLVRLAEFATGKPDSRPDTGSAWLRALTNEQLAIVSSWIEAATGGPVEPTTLQRGSPVKTPFASTTLACSRAEPPTCLGEAPLLIVGVITARLRNILSCARSDAARRLDAGGAADKAVREILELVRDQRRSLLVAALAMTITALLTAVLRHDLNCSAMQ